MNFFSLSHPQNNLYKFLMQADFFIKFNFSDENETIYLWDMHLCFCSNLLSVLFNCSRMSTSNNCTELFHSLSAECNADSSSIYLRILLFIHLSILSSVFHQLMSWGTAIIIKKLRHGSFTNYFLFPHAISPRTPFQKKRIIMMLWGSKKLIWF